MRDADPQIPALREVEIRSPVDRRLVPGSFQAPRDGAASGAPFLFFHGLNSSRDEHLGAYAELARGLARAGRASLRCDARAHGTSPAAPEEFTLLNLVRDGGAALDWLLDETGAERAVLVGTSFGGPPATLVASLRPPQVAGLALVAPAADLYGLFAAPKIPIRVEHYGDLVAEGVWGGRSIVADGRTFPPQLAFELATVDLGASLARTTCPVTIVHGDQDSIVPFADSEELARRQPRAQLHSMANTEHAVTAVGDPTGVTAASAANLARLEQLLLELGVAMTA